MAFERLPFLRNVSAFIKNVDSGNTAAADAAAGGGGVVAVAVVDTTAASVVVVVVAAAAAVVVVAAAAAAAAAADVATVAFLRFAFDFFPMIITIIRSGEVDLRENDSEYSFEVVYHIFNLMRDFSTMILLDEFLKQCFFVCIEY